MSKPKKTIQTVQIAKDHFATRFEHAPWCRGVGIGRKGGRLVLRVNVDPDAVLPPEVRDDSFEGVPIEVVRISGYKAR